MYEIDGVIVVTYYQDINQFHDEDGLIMYNIFEFITPNDLYLFRRNPEYYCVFPYKHNREILVIIDSLYYVDEFEEAV